MGITLIEQLYTVSKHELQGGEPSNLWAELNVAIVARKAALCNIETNIGT